MVRVSIFIFFGFLLSSCAERDLDKIGDAQDCIDKATAATVDVCVAKVDGLTSAGANTIRCTGYYIKQGMDQPERLTAIFEKLTGSSGENPIMAAAPLLAFKDVGNKTAKTLVSEAAAVCAASGSPGLAMISSTSKISTTLTSLPSITSIISSGGEPTSADYTAAVSQLAGEDNTTVGETVLVMNEQYCNGSGTSEEQICGDLKQAIKDDTNPESVGEKAKCVMEFDYTTELLVPTGNPSKNYEACKECNRLNCIKIVGLSQTQPGCGNYDANCGTTQ